MILMSFSKRAIEVVKAIKKGEVLTYGEVARCAGNAKAARAVGTLMAKNTDIKVPCHRVVKSDGGIGMYNGLQGESKIDLLKKEGVSVTTKGKVIVTRKK